MLYFLPGIFLGSAKNKTVELFVIWLFVVPLVIENLSNELPVRVRGFKSRNGINVLIQSVFNSFVSNRRVP